ncbi:MAG TPA: hypothetical protein VMD07_05430 [Candidatus Acidoferrales bacterium]|nr:hypothetical protein [Candidatus Acidoferrales bacterium]
MYYVEVLYARSRLFWFTAMALLVAAIFTYFVTFPPPQAHVNNDGHDVPFNAIVVLAGFFAAIMASILGATLNRDGSHLAYMWTKPIPRERIALSYIIIDVATILASFAVVCGVCSIVLAIPPQNHLTADASSGIVLARALAAPLMLYGIIEVTTSWLPTRLGAAGGIIWPIGLAIEALASINLPFPLAQIFYAINIFNPIAYLGLHGHGHVQLMSDSPLPFDFVGQTILALCIFVVSCIIATYNWKRMQA